MNLQQFRQYTAWHDVANRMAYDAPADPWKLLPVAPDDATYYTDELELNWGLGRVAAGRWDSEENRGRLRETAVYGGLEQRFEDGCDWEQTALYQRAKQRFESGEAVRGYDSLAEYRSVRCEYIDDLFHKIEREGYRPNEEATHEKATSDNAFEDAYANHLEPLVVVGRSGEIFWTEGYHRFAIASIVGVEEIPVYVLCRHAKWQQSRDRIHGTPTTELPPELHDRLDHPDVRDTLS